MGTSAADIITEPDAAFAIADAGVDTADGPWQILSPLPKFPDISLTFFDPSVSVSPQAKQFQAADYDAKRHQTIFYPEGEYPVSFDKHLTALGTVLVYNTDGAFTDPSSYAAHDLTSLVDPRAGGFCGGFMDEAHDAAYLSPWYNVLSDGGWVRDGLAVRMDLTQDLGTPGAYQKFDFAELGISELGYCGGIAVDGKEYFIPGNKSPEGGTLVMYDSSLSFTSAAAWTTYGLTNVHPQATGFQTTVYVAPYVYIIPYYNSVLVRYDTTKPMTSSTSYETVDFVSDLHFTDPYGYIGAVLAGSKLVFIPWDDAVNTKTNHFAIAFDTKATRLDSRLAWQEMDLRRVAGGTGGYQGGWLGKDGFVWFVPDNTLLAGVPPLITWNSSLPFDKASSWHAYSNGTDGGTIPPSTYVAYDPLTNTAWLSPYGAAKSNNYSITRVHY